MTATIETLPQLLFHLSKEAGNRTALITEDRRLTYAELADLAETYARSLVARGVTKGTRIGLLMENSIEWVAFSFAATSLGAILVPISTFAKAEEIQYQLRHADVAQLFASSRFLKTDYVEVLNEILAGSHTTSTGEIYSDLLPSLRRLVVRSLDDAEVSGPFDSWNHFLSAGEAVPSTIVRALADGVDPEDECYLLYTSGTTANPKGVLHRQKSIVRNGILIGRHQMLEPEDVVWFYFPFFFCAGCVNVLLGTFSSHASLIIQPTFDPESAIALIEREKASTWHVWPHQVKAMTSHPEWLRKDHSLLHKGTGAYDLMLDVGDRFDGMGGVGMYGMTETCTAFSCTYANEPPQIRGRTCGHVMAGSEMKIVDPETGKALDAGNTGEICVKGPSVMRRYYKVDPDETFDREGFFHTGDLGYLDDDGRVHFLQRKKDMIKSGGINISPADIEATLTKLGGVQEAFAFPIPGGDRGELVGAALVMSGPPDAEAVVEFCRHSFASHKRPVSVLVVRRGDLPMTGSGKVQKVKLAEMLVAESESNGKRWIPISR
jgi:fatty-acyl-CoA synthase